MFSRFFIDRPVFASVLSIVITLAGALSAFSLPLAQFPSITPPTVQVSANYPGASARDVAEAVAAPIEQQVNGVENMFYMSSQCANDGSYNLTVTFRPGVNLDMAQVMVQNRVSLAIPSLPDVIKQTGVTTRKRSPDILMGIALTSPDGRYDQLYLSNYAVLQVKDELARVAGVGDVFLFGQRDYSMRVWLDPFKLSARNLAASDVVRSIREENAQVATGSIGQPPVGDGQTFQVPLTTLGRLSEVEQFENIIVRATPDGKVTRLKDVARIELGSKSHDLNVRLDGKETVFLAIFQMPDANALDTKARVLAKLDDLKQSFPEGLDYEIGFDTTPYTRESIQEVFKTLRDAIVLVALVVLLFLQNWRSALIPLVAVPVAIVGTFAVMAVFGFSLNNLTLFGLVLAIGIVVDDAIVVVEAVEHHMEAGLGARDATIKAMDQVAGPVVAVGLVLSAVFVPCAFISGLTGAFFQQFALTIAASTVISAFNSLTLSPALTALLLVPPPHKEGHRVGDPEAGASGPLPRLAFALLGGWLGWKYALPVWQAGLATRCGIEPSSTFGLVAAWSPCLLACLVAGWVVGGPLNAILGACFRTFNAGFARATSLYTRTVGLVLRGSVVALLVYAGLVGLTGVAFNGLPGPVLPKVPEWLRKKDLGSFELAKGTPRGFVPPQDMGFLMVNVQLPDSASAERTENVMKQYLAMALEEPGIRHATYISGQSFVLSAAGSNFGSMFINLKDFADRRDPQHSSEAIANRLRAKFEQVYSAQVGVFGPPPVRGVGRAGGFAIMIEDRGDAGPQALQKEIDALKLRGFSRTVRKLVPDKNDPRRLVEEDVPEPLMMFSVFRANVPQLRIDPDKRECMSKGVRLKDFADTLQIYEGSLYVNDFNLFGRTWQVIVQAKPESRDQPEDLKLLTVRNNRGAMVPIGSLAKVDEVNGPLILPRYNMYPAAAINGIAPPGLSSGQVMDVVTKMVKESLPQNMAFEWTDMSFLEQKSGNTAMLLFGLAIAMVFLVLAAQYESWTLPLAVILVVPLCLLSSVVGVALARQDINIFTQIGFVVLVGLASKNAILIVEFAKRQHEDGMPLREAALAACGLRLRPIVMTSLAFVLGVVPLLVSHGAGAEMRRTLGTAVFSGMIGVTVFGIFLTPVFFVTIGRLTGLRRFAAPALLRASDAVLDVLHLGPVWRAAGALLRRGAPQPAGAAPARAVPTLGNGDAAHGPNGHQPNGDGRARHDGRPAADLTPDTTPNR